MWMRSECSRLSVQLWDYAALRLSADDTALVERHLLQCRRCREEAESYRQTVGMLTAVRRQPVPASQSTWRGLQARLETPRHHPASRSADWLPRLTLAGAGTVLAAMLLFVVTGSGLHRPASVRPYSTESARTTPSHEETQIAEAKAAGPEPSNLAIGDIFESFLPGQPALVRANVEPSVRSTVPVHASHSRTHGRTNHWTARTGSVSPPTLPSEPYTAQLDGGDATPNSTRHNFVMSPVTAQSEAETSPHYVIGSIPAGQATGASTSSNGDGSDEGGAL